MKRRGMRRRLPGLVIGAVLLMGLGAVGYLLLVYPRRAPAGEGEHLVVTLPERAGADEVAALLQDAGVIDDPWLFAVYMRVRGVHRRLRSGDVLLSDRLPPHEVARRISRGHRGLPVRVTIPEGLNRFEIAARLRDAGVCSNRAFRIATRRPIEGETEGTHEGYLFPDTYDFLQDSDAAEIARRMVANYRRRTDPIYDAHRDALDQLRRELGFGRRDVLTLASVVEEEAAAASERATIAGVFLNRLRSDSFRPRHRLQADPTVSYGCLAVRGADAPPSCESFDGRITRAMLQDPRNPYNTYRHGGLPPGPITNPGLASIVAVLEAEQHEYFYFVARGGGRHQFSAELEAHNDAVDRFILRDAPD